MFKTLNLVVQVDRVDCTLIFIAHIQSTSRSRSTTVVLCLFGRVIFVFKRFKVLFEVLCLFGRVIFVFKRFKVLFEITNRDTSRFLSEIIKLDEMNGMDLKPHVPPLLYPTVLSSPLLYCTLLYSPLLYSTVLYCTLDAPRWRRASGWSPHNSQCPIPRSKDTADTASTQPRPSHSSLHTIYHTTSSITFVSSHNIPHSLVHHIRLFTQYTTQPRPSHSSLHTIYPN